MILLILYIGIVYCVEIGYCAEVAVGSTVLAHSKIGNYAMLGASSLLTHEIPEGEIYVGSPAKFLKKMQNRGMGGVNG